MLLTGKVAVLFFVAALMLFFCFAIFHSRYFKNKNAIIFLGVLLSAFVRASFTDIRLPILTVL